MKYVISRAAKTSIINTYKTWKKNIPALNISNATKTLFTNISTRGLCVVSDVQLEIWVAKGYVVYRTMDSKWYFAGFYNKAKTVFHIYEALPQQLMADSAHDPNKSEHNEYHPKTPINNSVEYPIGQIISESINNLIREVKEADKQRRIQRIVRETIERFINNLVA